MAEFAKKIFLNCLILQVSIIQTVLFCKFCESKLHKMRNRMKKSITKAKRAKLRQITEKEPVI